MSILVYGIPNCDTVRKARAWLNQHAIEHAFHDVRKNGLAHELVGAWVEQVGWESLVNRKGMTWRGLPPERRAAVVDAASASALLIDNPLVLKRPVLVAGQDAAVGFSPEMYQQFFGRQP